MRFIRSSLQKKIAFYKYPIKDNIDTLRTTNHIGKKVICIVYNKDKIIKELDSFSINKAKIYPEIDDVADYIKNHVKDL